MLGHESLNFVNGTLKIETKYALLVTTSTACNFIIERLFHFQMSTAIGIIRMPYSCITSVIININIIIWIVKRYYMNALFMYNSNYYKYKYYYFGNLNTY